MYQLPEILKVTKELLYERLSQEAIMEYYLGLSPVPGVPYRNPLRKDDNPTAKFFYTERGELKFHDYGGFGTFSAIDIVMKKYHLNFPQALDKIAGDFGITSSTITCHPVSTIFKLQSTKPIKELKVRRRAWKVEDLEYWKAHGIGINTLVKYGVSPVSQVWVNGESVYLEWGKEVAFVYHFGGTRYKVYFPFRKKQRFLSSGLSEVTQGLQQLESNGELCIITKSLKDVMALHECHVPAVAPNAESQTVSEEAYMDIRSLGYNKIFVMYDFDYAGVKGANKTRKKFPDIIPIFMESSRPLLYKDFSGMVKVQGKEKALSHLKQLIYDSTKALDSRVQRVSYRDCYQC